MSTKNVFSGLSMLRAKEKEAEKKPVSEEAKKLQAYLASQYGSSEQPQKKKKKKPKTQVGVMRIVDQDASGFVELKNPGNEDPDEDQPVIANAEEAERLKLLAEKEKLTFESGKGATGWEAVTASPPRRTRHDSPGNNNDASPPRRRRHDSPDLDASPPRRRRHDSPDASPPRRRQRHDSGDEGRDASPPRRRRAVSDDDNDASPPRRNNRAHEDVSPPRRGRAGHSSDQDDGQQHDAKGQGGGSKNIMSDGTRTGFISGRELAVEMAKKREIEMKRFAQLDAETSGRNAKTVYRDSSGQQVTKEELLEKKAAERQKYEDQSAIPWGGGLKQQEEAEAARRRMQEEASKSFHRTYDADHDASQRDRLRFGDPMAHLVSKNRSADFEVPEALLKAQAEQKKRGGFVIPLQVPPHSWLKRGVGAPPNRYNIKPGRHWDGVDRSNGFERDMFKRITELRRREQEARMWNQGDM